jgi:hypothetical protein
VELTDKVRAEAAERVAMGGLATSFPEEVVEQEEEPEEEEDSDEDGVLLMEDNPNSEEEEESELSDLPSVDEEVDVD